MLQWKKHINIKGKIRAGHLSQILKRLSRNKNLFLVIEVIVLVCIEQKIIRHVFRQSKKIIFWEEKQNIQVPIVKVDCVTLCDSNNYFF